MMALLLNSIIMPADLADTRLHKDPEIAQELVQICKEVTMQYAPAIVGQCQNREELTTILSTLSGLEFFLRRRAATRVN